MLVNPIFQTYFKSCSILEDQKASKEDKLIAKICIASYFFILPPILFGIGYGISALCHWIWKTGSEDSTTVKTKEQFAQIVPPEQVQPEQPQQVATYPVVSQNMQQGFFVEVLNKGGYFLDGTNVILPPAGTPVKFTPASDHNFKESLTALRETYKIDDQREMQFQFKDRTTEEAINESQGSRIALNFANEHHIGGGPGFHKDPETGKFVYDAPSARAQEESLGQRSNVLVSLMQLSFALKGDTLNSKFIRSYYTEKFDSRYMAYVSLNHLFAVQGSQGFYSSRYLSEPKAVAFITSAAYCYGGESNIDCSKGSDAYKDARQRIETHLLAAAFRAGASKTENPDEPVELILGAFGCGIFAPEGNPDTYREMIAEIYKELLDDFHGFFDLVTFAVPSFGGQDPKDPAVANHSIFKRVLRLPVVSEQLKPGFFVDVLNRRGYVLQGKKMLIPRAGMPVKCARPDDFRGSLIALRKTLDSQRVFTLQFKDCTTEEAIDKSKGFRIALNFANELYMGGKPGIHRDPESGLLVYHAASTRAQEESLSQRSDLMASLTQLLHTFKKDSPFIRSCYKEEFDSRKMVYVSLNHLFAVQASQDFYESRYLSEPKAVTFITSAAKRYRDRQVIDCSKGLDVYIDARQRIETHLLAAATRAVVSKKDKPDEPVELILGAFGCGAFAPQGNPDTYREMIAGIYKELLPEFHSFFDFITFALPTFGSTDPANSAVANHRIFKKVLADGF